ncbi:MAG: LptF/LptG family permease [Bacteroidales bacterium]
MKKIYSLVIKSYVGPLFSTFFVVIFVLLMQFVWTYVDVMLGKGLSWQVIAKLLFYASFTFLPTALPISILLSSIMTFGNLGENNELVAIKTAGISMKKIFVPISVIVLFVSVATYFYYNISFPYANMKFRSTLYDVRQKKLALNIPENVFYSGLDGYVIKIGKKENDGSIIKNVMIYDHTDQRGNNKLIVADSGIMQKTSDDNFLLLTLFDGVNYEEPVETNLVRQKTYRKIYFKQEKIKFDLSQFQLATTDADLFKDSYHMLNSKQLRQASDSLAVEIEALHKETQRTISSYLIYYSYCDFGNKDIAGKTDVEFDSNFLQTAKKNLYIVKDAVNNVRNTKTSFQYTQQFAETQSVLKARHDNEFHRKFSVSFGCFVLFLIGAPLGIIIRRGGFGLPIVVSVVLYVIYHVISFTGEKVVRSLVIDSWLGMWMANIVLLPVGLLLMYYAVNDSIFLSSETYKHLYQRLKIKIKSRSKTKK